ncbi:MAG: acylphosphatase [Phycisphaerae bacterium]|nr:acylphosphatase [Phycisphaerae bacterium]
MRRKVVFSGRVQGVGFRATARAVAAGYDLSGAVRNLQDGSVELHAQGETSEIDRYLDELRGALRDFIRSETAENVPEVACERGFVIIR